jgi:hypothetical protein
MVSFFLEEHGLAMGWLGAVVDSGLLLVFPHG